RCGLRNYESGEFLCAENEQGFLEWRKIEGQACAQATECALGFSCAEGTCQIDNSLLDINSTCQTNDQCKTGHCATLLGGGEGLCVNRDQCIKTNGDGLVPIDSGESADGQFMCDNGELIIDQNNNQISDAKEIAYQGAVACQSDLQCPGALNSCEDLDQQTCWDAANTTVHCPALSQMFEYESLGANAYKIHAPLEFFSGEQATSTPNAAGGVGFDLSNSFETALWCAQPKGGEGGSICGDGIVSGGEGCDIASYQREVQECLIIEGEDLNGNGVIDVSTGSQTQYCSNECTIAQTECGVSATCGDGVVDAGEQCDDGVNNGRYGSTCSDVCVVDEGFGYCGDGLLQEEHEFCDISEGQCRFSYQEEGVIKPNIFFVIDHSGSLGQGGLDQVAEFANGVNGSGGFASLYHDKVQIGAIRFPNILNMGCGSDESNYNPVGEYDVAQISSMFTLIQNGQNLTPTPSVMQDVRLFGLYEDASDPLNDLRGKKVILITDGDPTCDIPGDDCTNDPVCVSVQNSEGYAGAVAKERRVRHTVAQIEALSALGVETYIVGFSSGANQSYLERFAKAGGTDTFYAADNAQGLLNSVEEIIGCTDYSLRAGNSCSADCQDFGGYCGDGIIQRSEGEQCDDGNYISDDGCNIYCKTGAVAEQPQDINGTCGDGVVQNPNNNGEEEVCDLGDQNGIACDPEYGESCTYCSHDCRENLTVDPIAQCGDGKIDFMREGTAGELVERLSGSGVNFSNLQVDSGINEGSPVDIYEACDSPAVSGDVRVSSSLIPIAPSVAGEPRISQLSSAVSVFSSLYLGRDDNPVFEELDNPSLSCETLFEDEDSPVLNRKWKVLRDNQVAVGEISCSNTCDALTIGCHICGDVTEEIPPYTDNERAEPKVKVHNVLGFNPQWYDALSPSFVFSKKEGEPISFFSVQDQQEQRLFSFRRFSMRNDLPVLEPLYIGSSLQCNRTLYLPSPILGFGIFKPMYGVQFNNLGHIFDFPVNNERDEVENEIFVSPAVPPDTFRVVVRFYKTDPTVYAGNVFSDEYGGLDGGLLTYKTVPAKCLHPGKNANEEYYRPVAFLGGVFGPCTDMDGSFVTVHQPFRGVGVDLPAFQDYAQATTITSPPAAGEPFAFFVDSYAENNLINGDVVRSGVNNNVTVELYRHHEGQNPEFSLYKPDYVFRMNLAEGSNNLGARYWHVFNLVHNGSEYVVQEANRDGQVITTDNATQYTSHNGSIETDYVDVLCNVPDQDCER
ncbi:MAG: VWA domain-containing protein, partial [Candidatus Magasanikbacteria bacterium]|nr:VWA domain-containing protein [Candidatus Magasanikbacteria bacterium]